MLKIENVHKHFSGVHALKDVSLELPDELVLAVVGDNGAGKSTLMKCITGVLNPDQGRIIFSDQDISKADPAISRSAGIEMIYQDLALCKMQDVVSNVFLGCEKKKGIFLDKALMAEICRGVFSDLGINLPLFEAAGSLSGGQQQAIAIARAMISKPKLLIMDEPTAALGVKESQKVLDYIVRLKGLGVSILIVSHNLSDIFQVADRIAVMRQGELKYQLSPQETGLMDLTARILGDI